MISIDRLKKVGTVFVHGNCPDGMASAMILKDAFKMLGLAPRVEFLVHNSKAHQGAMPPTMHDGWVLFCDISPWVPDSQEGRIEQVERMRSDPRAIVLDHHKEAEDIVKAFGENGVFAHEKLEPGVSGAVLAFREVWMVAQEHRTDARHNVGTAPIIIREVEEFARYVGARDTWQIERSVEFMRGQWISSMLMAKPASYWLDENEKGRPLLPYLNAAEMEGGRCLFEAHEEAVEQAVKQIVSFRLLRRDQPTHVSLFVFQDRSTGFRLSADVAEMVRKNGTSDAPGVVVGFYFIVDKPSDLPRLYFSLRGLNGFDVCAFAKANGGGGHTAAAAFSVPQDRTESIDVNPYRFIRGRLEAFL